MFVTRISRKALSIVAITLLAAGTAAAAAGGALPMFEPKQDEVVVEDRDNTQVTVADGDRGSSDVEASTNDDSRDGALPKGEFPNKNTNGDVDHHGKCTAWTNGTSKDATNPSFLELQVAADAASVTIADYCTTVLGADPSGNDDSTGDDADDDDSDDDDSDDQATGDDDADDEATDQADDDDDDATDDKAKDKEDKDKEDKDKEDKDKEDKDKEDNEGENKEAENDGVEVSVEVDDDVSVEVSDDEVSVEVDGEHGNSGEHNRGRGLGKLLP